MIYLANEIKEKVEKVSLQGIEIAKLLDADFLKQIKAIDTDIDPIALILIKFDKSTKGKEEKKPPIFIQLAHESNKDVENKIMHISSSDPLFVDRVKDIFKQNK